MKLMTAPITITGNRSVCPPISPSKRAIVKGRGKAAHTTRGWQTVTATPSVKPSQSKYREGETFGDPDILPESISSDLPAETIGIRNGTCAQFIVRGTPSTLPPNSLDISAYSIDGISVGVLNATEDNTSTFKIDLPGGSYILVALNEGFCDR
jgi:hypothetical protein